MGDHRIRGDRGGPESEAYALRAFPDHAQEEEALLLPLERQEVLMLPRGEEVAGM